MDRSVNAVVIGLSSAALAICSVIAVLTPGSRGYEVSLYQGFHPFFWICMGTALLGSILCLLPIADKKADSRGLPIALGTYLILFSLPVFRGYELFGRGGSDVLAHIGYTKGLLNTGLADNWYPFIHSQMGIYHRIGLNWPEVASTLSFIYTTLFVIGTALFVRERANSRTRFHVAAAVSLPLFLGMFTRSTHPAVYSFMMVPLIVLVAIWSDDSIRARLLLLILFAALVVFHPVTAGLLVVVLSVNTGVRTYAGSGSPRYIPIVVFMILLLSWYPAFRDFETSAQAIVLGLVRGANGGASNEVAAASSSDIFYTIRRFIEIYGADFILFGLAACAFLVFAYRYLEGIRSDVEFEVSTHMVIAGLVTLAFLVLGLIVQSPKRASRYLIWASIIAVSIGYPIARERVTQRRITAIQIGIVVLLLLSGGLSIGNVYQPHNQLTSTESAGADWYLDYSDGRPLMSVDMTYKMQTYLTNGENTWMFMRDSERYNAPQNLGQRDGSIQDEVDGSAYLATKTHDMRFYTWYPEDKWVSKSVYTAEDVRKLEDDGLAKIYSNGNFTIRSIS